MRVAGSTDPDERMSMRHAYKTGAVGRADAGGEMTDDSMICKQVPQEEMTVTMNARADERWLILQWVKERLRDYQSLPEYGATCAEDFIEHRGRVNQLKELECYLSQRRG